MRILYHHRTQAEDGQAIHIRALTRAFEAAGHEVIEVGLVRRSNGGGAPSRWRWVSRVPGFVRELMEYGYNGLARHQILREAVRCEPDFLYERYAFGNAAGVLAARKLGIPIVLEVNSPMVEELARTRGLSFPRLARRVERFVFSTADRVCTVSGVLRDMLVEQGVSAERLVVTPNGVDLATYAYPDRASIRTEARRELGLPEDAGHVLGFVGYFRKWHRLDVVLRALAEPGLEKTRLVIVGEGPAHDELAEEARRLGSTERVHFCGPRPHARIPQLLPAFDAALIPAINPYASPLKLYEYMAASLAVIAPDQPNLREVLVPGENALLVPPGNDEAMADAVRRLADPALRGRLGANARRTIEEKDLTWAANVRRVLDAVETLV